MKVYAAIDLHSNNSVLSVVDENGQLRHEARYPNELPVIVEALQPQWMVPPHTQWIAL